MPLARFRATGQLALGGRTSLAVAFPVALTDDRYRSWVWEDQSRLAGVERIVVEANDGRHLSAETGFALTSLPGYSGHPDRTDFRRSPFHDALRFLAGLERPGL